MRRTMMGVASILAFGPGGVRSVTQGVDSAGIDPSGRAEASRNREDSDSAVTHIAKAP